jgi:hypothetical protein
VRDSLTSGDWAPTGDVLQPQSSGPVFFERGTAGGAQFFRVLAE